jgi:site-specific DNA recombinase
METSIYDVAAYLRLSRDDKDIDGSTKSESNSIRSQRELIRSYIKEHEDLRLFDIYVDDGYSGVHFDRPEFQRMMADIEAGNVNCVIVKDLSRLGREYIEAGRLIQKIFPAFCVRFIAVTDGFDSQTADYNTKSLVLPVKNFINDSYCRDISQKVRSQQKVKREQGKFIGAFAVYGYRKSTEDKNKLCPDPYAATIVRQIFAWKLEGMSSLAIAQKLNDLGVRSPLEYKRMHGENFFTGFQTNVTAKWSAMAVKRILSNEMYTGVMVQGKRERVNYKMKEVVVKPGEEWVRVEGTHDAIISREDFEMVQKLLTVDTRAKAGTDCAHIFSGFLFCGDCREPMIRRVNRYRETEKIYFICPTRNRGEGCTRHSILEAELREVVFQILQIQISVFWDAYGRLEDIRKLNCHFETSDRFHMFCEEEQGVYEEVEWIRRERDKYRKLLAGLYEDYKTGVITEKDFQEFREIYRERCEELEDAFEKQKELAEQISRNNATAKKTPEQWKEEIMLTELTRDLLLGFINKIEVYEDRKIYIEFRWREEFEKILH